MDDTAAGTWIRRGLWALPLYGLLTLAGTVTHQPDPSTDFQGYAEYVVTDRFLASHLLASILGSAVGILGVVALGAQLARGRTDIDRTIAALVLSVVGLVLITSVFGAAAFAQPAVGDAQLAGRTGAQAFNDAVYGTPLVVTVLVGVLLYSAGTVVFGTVLWRGSDPPRWTGVLFAASAPLISVAGLFVGPAQTVGSLLLLGAGVAICRSARPLAARPVVRVEGRIPTAAAGSQDSGRR